MEARVKDRVSTILSYRKNNVSFLTTIDMRTFLKDELHDPEMVLLGIAELQKLGEWHNKGKSHGGD